MIGPARKLSAPQKKCVLKNTRRKTFSEVKSFCLLWLLRHLRALN